MCALTGKIAVGPGPLLFPVLQPALARQLKGHLHTHSAQCTSITMKENLRKTWDQFEPTLFIFFFKLTIHTEHWLFVNFLSNVKVCIVKFKTLFLYDPETSK